MKTLSAKKLLTRIIMSLPRCGTKMADAAFPRIPKTNKRNKNYNNAINASFFFTFKMVPISPRGWIKIFFEFTRTWLLFKLVKHGDFLINLRFWMLT